MDYYGLLAQANLQDCSPMDSACVSNNVAKQAAVETLWIENYMTKPGGAPDDLVLEFTPQTAAQVREFYNPQDLFNSGNVVDTSGILHMVSGGGTTAVRTNTGNGATAVAARGGSLSFSTSRGSAALRPGDTWRVSITGASPNTQVSVQGGKNGARDIAAMGVTDSSGNFSVSGTITADQLGAWSETWSVGSAVSGSFAFTVAAGDGGSPVGGLDVIAGLLPASVGGFSIPWWGWLAGAGAAVFAFSGGGRGR